MLTNEYPIIELVTKILMHLEVRNATYRHCKSITSLEPCHLYRLNCGQLLLLDSTKESFMTQTDGMLSPPGIFVPHHELLTY